MTSVHPAQLDDNMRACLYSGGKDSTLALHIANAQKKVDFLLTIISDNDNSYMFHKPAINFTKMQAQSMGIKQITAKTAGQKEIELEDLQKAFKDNDVTEIITGAVASTYQKARIDSICNKLNILHISPLWGMEPLDELKEIAKHYKAIIVRVAADGLDDSFLGSAINEETVKRLVAINLKKKINLSFEGGEAESFVLDAPLFKKSILIKKSHKIWNGSEGNLIIDSAELVDKS